MQNPLWFQPTYFNQELQKNVKSLEVPNSILNSIKKWYEKTTYSSLLSLMTIEMAT
jgi:hypothetical protein